MGSFSIACGLSGLPITEGDRAAFIPLSPSKYKVESVGPTFTDPCQFFAPILPPVIGTYDGYGRIKDPEVSDVTALLEAVSNRSITTAVRTLTDDRGFYDPQGERFSTYVTEPGMLADHNASLAEVLESLGFTAHHTFAGQEFELQGHKLLLQDGRAKKIRYRGFTMDIDPRVAHRTEDVLALFADHAEVIPGVAAADQKAAKLARSTTGMFVHPGFLTGMAETICRDIVYARAAKTVEASWDDLQERFARMDPTHPEHNGFLAFPSLWSDNALVDAMRNYASWEPDQYGYMEHLDQASVLSMMQVVDVANALGRTLGPTQYLSEVDSVEYAQAAHRIAGEMLDRQVARRE